MKRQLFSGASCGVLLALLVLVMSGCVTSDQAKLTEVKPRMILGRPLLVPDNAPFMETIPAGDLEQSSGDIISGPKKMKHELAPMPMVVPKFPRENGTTTI